MELEDVQRRLLEIYGIRVEPEMAKYIFRRLNAGGAGGAQKLQIIGGHAKTGAPMRMLIDPATLAQQQPAPATVPASLFPQ